MFIVAPVTSTKHVETTQTRTNGWMNFKKRYTTESYSVIKSNKVLTHAATQMNFENMLSEEVKTQKATRYKIPLIWYVQNRHRGESNSC